MLLPFTQSSKGDVQYLHTSPVYRREWKANYLNRGDMVAAPEYFIKKILENLPDYYACLFAIVKYKQTDILIPIENKSAKITFKNRDRDSSGVKRHLIHNVSQYARDDLKTQSFVRDHLRGTSSFRINGLDVVLMASWEWSIREQERRRRSK